MSAVDHSDDSVDPATVAKIGAILLLVSLPFPYAHIVVQEVSVGFREATQNVSVWSFTVNGFVSYNAFAAPGAALGTLYLLSKNRLRGRTALLVSGLGIVGGFFPIGYFFQESSNLLFGGYLGSAAAIMLFLGGIMGYKE